VSLVLGNDVLMDAHKLHTHPTIAKHSSEEGELDVVIVSADMGEMTFACVSELRDAQISQITVVDNAFGEAIEQEGELRERIGEAATIVSLDAPHGFAAANNRGLEVGKAPYVLLLNSDILLTAGAVEALERALREDPQAVAAGGRLVDPDTLITQAGYRPRPFPSLANFVVILLGIEELWPGNPISSRYHGGGTHEHGVQEVEQPAAAALLARRSDLEAVQGFDERFWFWFEDSDLLLRLSRRGRILYAPQAVFRHLGGGTFRRWSKCERIRSVHHGIIHYADAHFSRLGRFALGFTVVAISLPRIALFHSSHPEQARAWRAVLAGGLALIRGRRPPVIAPDPGT
jgi:GT2 family glycosyltransferase